MAVIASGTITPAAIGVEEQLTSQTVARYYHASINMENMTDGDVVVITIRKKVLSTETIAVGAKAGIVYEVTFTYQDSQIAPVAELPPLKSEHEYMLSINQTAGTVKAYNWSVYDPT